MRRFATIAATMAGALDASMVDDRNDKIAADRRQ
jgi:hypothetical protein